MAKRKKTVPPLDVESNKDHSISAKLADHERRRKLLSQIALLRTYVSALESRLETPKFGQLQLPTDASRDGETAARCNVLDIRTKLRYDLYRFTGVRCTKCEGSFVFEVSGADSVTGAEPYAVEILMDSHGCGKLGKWVLPMSIDVQGILSRHPIEDLNNVRQFLKSCKHHVDCYICRAKQLEELRNFLADVKNARVSQIVGISQIELVMSGVKDIENDAICNVILYLCYNSAEVRPYKLLLDTDDSKEPSASLLKRLNKHFKPFLKNDLSSAFKWVNESQTEFLWEPITSDVKEISDESFEATGFLSTYLHRGNKKQKASKNKEQDKEIMRAAHDNEMESSLRVEGEERKNSDVKENKKRDFMDSKKIDLCKQEQFTRRKTLFDAKEPSDDSKQFEKEVLNVEKRSDRYVTDENNKSEAKVTSAASRIQRRKKSKKHQTDVNNGKKKVSVRNRKLLEKSNDSGHEDSRDPRAARKRRKTITREDKRDKENCAILDTNKQIQKEQMNLSNSTPTSKKLPDKRKFFHASRISEICRHISESEIKTEECSK
ncbi:uncharacterized protein LOC105191249 [Harpegnathos saltator]|uniref:Uncharacterized protein n=1 Tax=Harpegnathos saltator TaxID=610380 RepID=E2C8Z2_HARSA|nr:uncharacterized protein LOC105191249 [Harpegnathos saltator]EFN75610.1 hypothetical protein EAI_04577 [Harpegnathos saltator]